MNNLTNHFSGTSCNHIKFKSLILACLLTFLASLSLTVQAQSYYVQPQGFATIEKLKNGRYSSDNTNQITLVGKLISQVPDPRSQNENSNLFIFTDGTGEILVLLNKGVDWSELVAGELIHLSGFATGQGSELIFVATQGAPSNRMLVKCK